MLSSFAIIGVVVFGAIVFGYGFRVPEGEFFRYVVFASGVALMASPLAAAAVYIEETLEKMKESQDEIMAELKKLSQKEKS